MFMTKDARSLLLFKDVTDFLVCETLSHKLSDCQCGATLTSLAMHCLLFLYCIIIGANCFFSRCLLHMVEVQAEGQTGL